MIVTLPADLTISQAPQLRAALLTALQAGEAVELDARAVATADVAGLQLLVAAAKSAAAQPVALGFLAQGRSEALDRAAAQAGLGDGVSSSLWPEAPHG